MGAHGEAPPPDGAGTPANTPKILFVASDASNPPNADADLMNFFDANGYQTIAFHSSGYATEPDDLRAATAGKVMVFISESIGSTSPLRCNVVWR